LDTFLKKAVLKIEVRGLFRSRPKMWLRLPTLQQLVQSAMEAGAVQEGVLYIAAYAFVLGVPSETLPITICMRSADARASAAMYSADDSFIWPWSRGRIAPKAICCGDRVGARNAN